MKEKKISKNDFYKVREEILKTWPTGDGLLIEDGIRYQETIPKNKNFALAMLEAKKSKKILLQPRAGVASIDKHIELLNYLETEGEADLLPTTIDAYTRQNQYKEAELGIKKSHETGTSLLNGFPAVNYGIFGCRKVVESVSKPIQVRHGTPDARLLAEITLASGFTSFEGGGISYNVPYSKKVPIKKSIEDWKYVDRLVGIYEEFGITINREPFGPLTGTLIPPSIGNTIAIVEGILALEQGVKSITLGYGQAGNILQDVAAIISLRELADEYFHKEGFKDYQLTTVFHQWMGGFPKEESRAFAVISWGAVVASFARVNKIIVKTPHEAMGIPTAEANTQGLQTTRQIINMLQDQFISGGDFLRREIEIQKKEIKSLMASIYTLGNGNISDGIVRSFEAGTMDVPFAPSQYNNGKVLPIRDDEGCVRLFHFGNLPFDNEIKDYHKKQLNRRAKTEKRDVSFQMVTDDIYAISKGKLVGRPKK